MGEKNVTYTNLPIENPITFGLNCFKIFGIVVNDLQSSRPPERKFLIIFVRVKGLGASKLILDPYIDHCIYMYIDSGGPSLGMPQSMKTY